MNQVIPTIRTVCQFVGTDIGQTVHVVEFGRTSVKPPQFKNNIALKNGNLYLYFGCMNLWNVMMSSLQLTLFNANDAMSFIYRHFKEVCKWIKIKQKKYMSILSKIQNRYSWFWKQMSNSRTQSIHISLTY